MRIGILTFHFAYNYGAVLQAYALSHFLKSQGHDVKIINYIPNDLRHLYTLNPFIVSRKKEILSKFKKMFRSLNQFQLFESFILKDLALTKKIDKNELIEMNNEFDAFIVGSDQIWNENIMEDNSPYFLSFANIDKYRYSFAASFGTKNISDSYLQKRRDLLLRFNEISVRESEAKKSLSRLNLYSEVVSDPVFLISKRQWQQLIRPVKKITSEKFILCYSLSGDSRLDRFVESLSQKRKCKVVVIHSTCEKVVKNKKFYYCYKVGPREFLYLIQNMSCLVTNSFHGTAFSLIFGKEVYNISDIQRRERVDSMIKEFGLNVEVNNDYVHIPANSMTNELRHRVEKVQVDFLNKCGLINR